MNKLKLLAIFSLFILLPNVTYADCTKEEKDYFKQVEKEYKVTYKFNQETDDYTLIFYNPYPERYTFLYENSDSNGIDFDYDGNTMILYISGFSSGVYDYEIVGITDTCDDTLKEGTVNLTKRNNYYNDPLCEGIEEFVLCQPTYDKEIDYDTFVSRVNTYKKTKQEKVVDEPQKETEPIQHVPRDPRRGDPPDRRVDREPQADGRSGVEGEAQSGTGGPDRGGTGAR